MEKKSLYPWNWFKHENEKAQQDRSQASSMFSPLSNFSNLSDFQREFDRYFNQLIPNFSQSGFSTQSDLPQAFTTLKPCVDISEDENQYTIRVELPGVDEKDLKLDIKDNVLTLNAEKKIEKEDKDKSFHRVERSYGTLQRSFTLPKDANYSDIQAGFKKGVLNILVPRQSTPQSDSRKIEVKAED